MILILKCFRNQRDMKVAGLGSESIWKGSFDDYIINRKKVDELTIENAVNKFKGVDSLTMEEQFVVG